MNKMMTENEEESCPASETEEDSIADSDSWDEEESSEDSGTEDLIVYQDRFLSLIDTKIKLAEQFCDHKQYVLSFAPPVDHPSVEPGHVPAETRSSSNLEDATESARDEITKLRTARDIFLGHKTEVGDRLKKVDSEEDSRWLYECEEAMEAIDTIIDYKNEIICGRVENSSLRLFSAKNREEEADTLMSRLTNVSLSEQNRLFCKFFNKVVELRHSTKELEKTNDQLIAENEEMCRCIRHYKKKLRKQEEANADCLKLLMSQGACGVPFGKVMTDEGKDRNESHQKTHRRNGVKVSRRLEHLKRPTS